MKPYWVRLGSAFLLVSVIFLILTRFFWNFVRDTIAVPIYYLVWLADLMLKSIPQTFFLGFLVVVCIIIGLNALSAISTSANVESVEPVPVQSRARYRFWRSVCARLDTSPYSREKFAAESRKLILSILAYEEGIENAEAEARVRAGAFGLPATVRDLILQPDSWSLQQQPGPENTSLFARLRGIFGKPALRQIDSQISEIISYIEQH